MHFDGSVPIRAERQRVWDFLIDPRQVARCGPGVDSVDIVDETHFRIVAKIGIGMIKATFAIDCRHDELRPPDHAAITGTGKAPGSAVDGRAEMSLRDGEPGVTVMDWVADVHIHGRLASLGARLIEGTAGKMIDQTFDCIRARLEA